MERKFGWIRDSWDERDFKYSPKFRLLNLKRTVDLRSLLFPPIYDQLSTSSCTSNAWIAVVEYVRNLDKKRYVELSRLFHYWCERLKEGTATIDGGAMIRTGIKVLVKQGVCPESMFEFSPENLFKVPPSHCFEIAALFQSLQYQKIRQGEYDLKSSIAEGYPIVFGAKIYDSFMSEHTAKTGIVSMPKSGERCIGGHAIVKVGYTIDGIAAVHSKGTALLLSEEEKAINKWWIVRNSWSSKWGDNGHCYIPFDYTMNYALASDFWKVTKSE